MRLPFQDRSTGSGKSLPSGGRRAARIVLLAAHVCVRPVALEFAAMLLQASPPMRTGIRASTPNGINPTRNL